MQRTIEVDMSPTAIEQRLRDLGQLYRLGVSLRSARYLGTVEEIEALENSRFSEKLGQATPR